MGGVGDGMDKKRREFWARVAVSAGALLPYLPALTFNKVFVTDDVFTSDIFNGELPGRVLAGQLLAKGQAPVWTNQICSGYPLAAGGVTEPLSLTLFSQFPTAPALCLLVIVTVLVAAHGAYGFARRLGAHPSGAVLAGIAFGGSGYLVTQLKHLAIVSTVAWLPWGLLLLDRAFAVRAPPPIDDADPKPLVATTAARFRDIGLFGLVFAEQICSGFPQSVYICGLVYAVWALVLLARDWRGLSLSMCLVGALGVSSALAVCCGSTFLLPLAELGKYSDRGESITWEFASMAPYTWTDLLNFALPYANGDIAEMTYRGEGIFWENYGYVGLATLLLSIWAAARSLRRPRVLLLISIAVICQLLVLGKHTPLFHLAWQHLPGMGRFRFPTRFLVVVDLVLALLGGIGLSLLQRDLRRWLATRAPNIPHLVAPAIVVATALDLFINQSHQNPFVPAEDWLADPPSLADVDKSSARLYAPFHNDLHMLAFRVARGWSNLEPYRLLRDTIAPNTGAYYGVASADCYAGLLPAWVVDVWGDHSRFGRLVPALMRLHRDAIQTSANFANVLATYGVTHVISPVAIPGLASTELRGGGSVYRYQIQGKRVRIVPKAQVVGSATEALGVLAAPEFDPADLVVLHRRRDETLKQTSFTGSVETTRAEITQEDARHVRVQTVAENGGFLLLADNYYLGWRATVDGQPATLYRANIASRAVVLPPGTRSVEFTYDAGSFYRGLKLAAFGLGLLVTWVVIGGTLARPRKTAGNASC